MKTINFSQNKNINNNLLLEKRKHQMRQAFKEQNNMEKYNNRPAQAISFGGSAGFNKGVNKAINGLVENKGKLSNFVNGTIKLVNENEAAYNAIYSLIVAGILKPMAVLNMPGSEEKDKQIVATKNFLQAFLGSFLGLTVGGGFVKKSIDVVKNNLKLIDATDPENLKVFGAETKQAKKVAKAILQKEENGIGKKLSRATEMFKHSHGLSKISNFAKTMFKDVEFEPSKEAIAQKAKVVVKNFEENHFPIFKNNKNFVATLKSGAANAASGTTYADAFEVLWKNSTGALTAIGKAKISSLLLPGVMAFLFAKKNLEKAQAQKTDAQAKETTLTNNTSFKNQQEQFQKIMNLKSDNQVSFKGSILPKMIDGFAQGIETIGMSKPGEKAARLLAKTKKPSARMSDIESFAITAYWLQNTARSKKIEPSQKLGLNVHSALVTAVSSTAAFIIDWACDGLIDKTKDAYKGKLNTVFKEATKNDNFKETIETGCKNMLDGKKIVDTLSSLGKEVDEKTLNNTIEDLTKKYGKKLSKFKSLTIFTLVVRFLVPVMMVPFSGKLKKKIIEWTDGKPNNENKAEKKENK